MASFEPLSARNNRRSQQQGNSPVRTSGSEVASPFYERPDDKQEGFSTKGAASILRLGLDNCSMRLSRSARSIASTSRRTAYLRRAIIVGHPTTRPLRLATMARTGRYRLGNPFG